MDDLSKIKAAMSFMPILHELNDNKIIKLFEKYPSFNTTEQNVEIWWNGLDFDQKIEVGSVALHYGKMTPNYKWKCADEHKFEELTNGQKNIVKFVFSKRNDNWYMFDLASMLKI